LRALCGVARIANDGLLGALLGGLDIGHDEFLKNAFTGKRMKLRKNRPGSMSRATGFVKMERSRTRCRP
jgi:hypothetical protein